MAKIQDLLSTIDKYTEKLKDAKAELKELVEETDMYKSIYNSTVSTVGDNGFEVSEKDAAIHAYKITLKNLKKLNE